MSSLFGFELTDDFMAWRGIRCLPVCPLLARNAAPLTVLVT